MSDVDEPYTHSTSTNHMMIESHHVGLIEFVADGYSFGIGGIFVDKEENLILVPEKFLLNPSFKKFFAELCSDDPKNCIVEAFTISSRFTF